MFANRFSNNKYFMSPKGDICKPMNMHYSWNNLENMGVQIQKNFPLRLMNSINMTNTMTNKYFSQRDYSQNFGNGLKEFGVQLPFNGKNGSNHFSTPEHEKPVEEINSTMSGMYSYLIDLIGSFFYSWKNLEQEPKDFCPEVQKPPIAKEDFSKDMNPNKNCDLTNNHPNFEIMEESKESIINNTNCDIQNYSTADICKICSNNSNIEETLDLCSSKYSREINRLKKLKKRKERRMAAEIRNRNSNRRRRVKDCNKNKLYFYNNNFCDELLSSSCESHTEYDNYDDSYEKLLLENLKNISKTPPTFTFSPIIIDTGVNDETTCSSFKNSNQRPRNISECESEDSFIVFCNYDDNRNITEDEQFGSEFDDEDCSSHYSEDCFTEYDEYECPNNAQIQISPDLNKKRVRFANDDKLCTVHRLVKWSYAYQAARRGPWEEYARDRERFRRRIFDTENELNIILDPKLREKIYLERFANCEVEKSNVTIKRKHNNYN